MNDLKITDLKMNDLKMKRQESFIKGFDGNKIYTQSWLNENSVGTILITHGHGEHSECYLRLIDSLNDSGWDFLAWDLRGHGRSDGKRGYVMHFDDYCKDYEMLLETLLSAKLKKPFITLSHSMGGLIHTKTILNNSELQSELTAQCLSAPFFGLSLPVPAWKLKSANLIYSFKPDLTLGNEISYDMLTRDSEVLREYQKDNLRHERISPGAFLGSVSSWDFIIKNAHKITIPTLLQMSDKDPVASTQSALNFYENITSKIKEVYLYPDAKHEIYNDIIRKDAFADLKNFLNQFKK